MFSRRFLVGLACVLGATLISLTALYFRLEHAWAVIAVVNLGLGSAALKNFLDLTTAALQIRKLDAEIDKLGIELNKLRQEQRKLELEIQKLELEIAEKRKAAAKESAQITAPTSEEVLRFSTTSERDLRGLRRGEDVRWKID